MNTFANSARNVSNITSTENGAVALRSTQSALVDLFATVGSLRVKSEADVRNAFDNALAEDKLLGTKLMFYARNIRGGLGERKTFRIMLKRLAESYPEVVRKNLHLIPLFGRFDDLYTLIGTKVETNMWNLISENLLADSFSMRNKGSVSLCAKWLKSINTSSAESQKLGKLTAKNLGFSEREYRKILSALRAYINLTEVKMSAKDWEEIDYSKVPSRAMKNYRKAFGKHDAEGFAKFITKVEKGEAKIHSATLFPYDIMRAGELRGYGSRFDFNYDAVLEAQWKALPNYVDEGSNILIMADTSASMNGVPIATAIGLAIYFAERNVGAYKDLFLTFSESPSFVDLSGAKTLKDKVARVPAIVANTDLEKAFDLILGVAIKNRINQDEMPKSLVVISDMQFDSATNTREYGYGRASVVKETFHESMERKFANAGYTMPSIVYWQVEERQKSFQVTHDKNGVILVSGQGTSVFKSILTNVGKTPWDFMYEALSDPQYDCVTI